MKIWIIAEANHGRLSPVTYELIGRAQMLGAEHTLGALVISPKLDDFELAGLIDCGVDTVLTYEADFFKDFNPVSYTRCILVLNEEFHPDVILGSATTAGRTLLPYAAMKLNTGLTADCTLLAVDPANGKLLQTRPAIGGNIMATIKTPDTLPQMATIRPHSNAPCQRNHSRHGGILRRTAPAGWQDTTQRVLDFIPDNSTFDLSSAETIVVVGRGIKKAETLNMIREFADLIGAALGASREVIDRGWLPYHCQIGLSGKTVTPKLYIGLGVSGAIQHLAGMQTSEKIIAVNTDPEAQIFSIADVGIVGNLNDVVPQLIQQYKKQGSL